MADTEYAGFFAALIKIFKGLFFLVMAALFISLCFFNNATYIVNTARQLIYAVVLAGVMVGCGFLFTHFWKTKHKRKEMIRRFPLVLCVCMTVVYVWQFVMIMHISKPIGWDVETVITSAFGLTEGREEYFSRYPNNMFLVFFFRPLNWVFSWLGVQDGWLALSAVNAFIVDISFVMAILLAEKVYGTKAAYATLGISVLFLAQFPWIIVPYSDTISMPFTIGTVACYAAVCRAKSTRRRVVYCVLLAVVLVAGILIKPTVAIIGIAIALAHVLYTLAGPKPRGLRLAWMALPLCLAGVLFFAAQSFLFSQTYIPIERGKSEPLSHFISIGLTKQGRMYGAFHPDDAAFSYQFETTAEKDAAIRVRIREKLEERGALGTLEYTINKARWIMAEGTFTWGYDGTFNVDYTRPQSLFTDLYFRYERYHNAYLHMAQAIWIVIFFLFTSLTIMDGRNIQNRYTTIMQLGIFGLLAYLVLSEARARYLINYLPLFVLLAGNGYVQLGKVGKRVSRGLRREPGSGLEAP